MLVCIGKSAFAVNLICRVHSAVPAAALFVAADSVAVKHSAMQQALVSMTATSLLPVNSQHSSGNASGRNQLDQRMPLCQDVTFESVLRAVCVSDCVTGNRQLMLLSNTVPCIYLAGSVHESGRRRLPLLLQAN